MTCRVLFSIITICIINGYLLFVLLLLLFFLQKDVSCYSIREIAILYATNKNGLLAISVIIFKRMIFIGEIHIE